MSELIAENNKLIEKFEVHRDFTKVFLDGFILVNSKHNILKFNSAFCQIVDLRAVDIRKVTNFDAILETKYKEKKTASFIF